jgi:hypothetical protein
MNDVGKAASFEVVSQFGSGKNAQLPAQSTGGLYNCR